MILGHKDIGRRRLKSVAHERRSVVLPWDRLTTRFPYSDNPKANSALPAGITMYCFPSSS